MKRMMIEQIDSIPHGKSFGSRGADSYYLIAKRPEGLVVECGWTVPESDSDDPESYSYNPFKGRERTPAWVGMRQQCETAAQAAAVYETYKTAVQGKQRPTWGDKIGSVVR